MTAASLPIISFRRPNDETRLPRAFRYIRAKTFDERTDEKKGATFP